jgi:Peptidase_C39 like family
MIMKPVPVLITGVIFPIVMILIVAIAILILVSGCLLHPVHRFQAIDSDNQESKGSMQLKYRILDVPLFGQQTRMWCWAAIGEMVSRYYGKGVPQHVQANNRFNRLDCGSINRQNQRRCVRGGRPEFEKYGFKSPATKYGALSWEQLVLQIDALKPVGFSWEWKGCKTNKSFGSHYMVARGYFTINDKKFVVVNDPWPANGDRFKGGSVIVMTYLDYVSFCHRYIHSYSHFNLMKNDIKPDNLNVMQIAQPEEKKITDCVIHPSSKLLCSGEKKHAIKEIQGTGQERALHEAITILNNLPQPLLKQLGIQPDTIIKRSIIEEPLAAFVLGSRRMKKPRGKENAGQILANAFEIHYPIVIDQEPVTSIIIRKRAGQWNFALIGDKKAVNAFSTLKVIPAPRGKKPEYFILHIQSMNLTFLAYFLENKTLYLVPTTEEPDLNFKLHHPLPAEEVILELLEFLEPWEEGKTKPLPDSFTQSWIEILDEISSGNKNRAIDGLERALELINQTIGRLEDQKDNMENIY